MRKLCITGLASLTVLLFGASLIAQAQSWTYTGSMAVRRADHTVTLLQSGEVLVSGGQ